jgi:hypothetical protein
MSLRECLGDGFTPIHARYLSQLSYARQELGPLITPHLTQNLHYSLPNLFALIRRLLRGNGLALSKGSL